MFRLVVGLIGLFVFAGLAAIVGAMFVVAAKAGPGGVLLTVIGVFAAVLICLPVGIVFGLVAKFTKDFVVPIMYIYNCTCVNGWKYFLNILSGNKWRFTLYILFQIVIVIAIAAIVGMVSCITCCCAACILAIPYLGAVLMLPVTTFLRAYSLLYLRQYGPNFDAFREPQPLPTPAPASDQWQP